MNYIKLHDAIINNAKLEQESGVRVKGNGIYYEKHHIKPKCLKGNNDSRNLVLLTAREHFLIHWILTKIYKDDLKLVYALGRFNKGLEAKSSILYKYAREKFIYALKHNDEWKKKMGKSMEQLIWIKNEKTNDCLRIHRDSLKDFEKIGYEVGRIIEERCATSQLTKQKIADSHKGKKLSVSHKKSISEANSKKIWLNNGVKDTHTMPEKAKELIKQGWVNGRLKNKNSFGKLKGNIWIFKNGIIKSIRPEKTNDFLKEGWMIGNGKTGQKIWNKAWRKIIAKRTAGTLWINNGTICKRVTKNKFKKMSKEGWIIGRIKKGKKL